MLTHCSDVGLACTGDVIYTNMPTQGPDAPIPNVQYFWEAFPSGSGSTDRTTYLFTYIDADPSRCSSSVSSPLWLPSVPLTVSLQKATGPVMRSFHKLHCKVLSLQALHVQQGHNSF